VYSVETNIAIFHFSPSGSHTILVFLTKRYGNIPTANPPTGVSNAGGVGLGDSQPISGSIASCERFDYQVVAIVGNDDDDDDDDEVE